MKTNNYEGIDGELINEIVNEMYDSNEYMCGLSEIVSACCGKKYYANYGKEELDYVKEIMEEFCRIYVEFDEENEVMSIQGEVDDLD
jgi:hypothetical protein